METTLLLTRHGQTPWNALGKIQGCTDINLGTQGIEQAQQLSKRLQGNFTKLYSSPLQRAYETACIVGEPIKLTPIILDELKEINFGAWEGLSFQEVATHYPEDYYAWHNDPSTASITNGEQSLKQYSLHSRDTLLNLVQKHTGETIVVVSHVGFIRASLIGLFDFKMKLYHQLALGNTCINTIKFDKDFQPILVGLNDTHHLSLK